jgi:hypothetical protein
VHPGGKSKARSVQPWLISIVIRSCTWRCAGDRRHQHCLAGKMLYGGQYLRSLLASARHRGQVPPGIHFKPIHHHVLTPVEPGYRTRQRPYEVFGRVSGDWTLTARSTSCPRRLAGSFLNTARRKSDKIVTKYSGLWVPMQHLSSLSCSYRNYANFNGWYGKPSEIDFDALTGRCAVRVAV